MNNEIDNTLNTPIKPNLSVITGGRGGDGNWLASMPVNTAFLVKPKLNAQNIPPYLRFDFQVVWKSDDGVDFRLVTNTESTPIYQWVNSNEFCVYNDLKRVLVDGNEMLYDDQENEPVTESLQNDKENNTADSNETNSNSIEDN